MTTQERIMPNDLQAVVDAVQDLTRVLIATHDKFASRADVVRKLADLSVPPTRIAAILAMPPKEVHSVLAKARKRAKHQEMSIEGENGSTA
jgi:mannose/fructose-specific phosphotransferase system component IIA